jgi:Domain of unknown function (DUF892)
VRASDTSERLTSETALMPYLLSPLYEFRPPFWILVRPGVQPSSARASIWLRKVLKTIKLNTLKDLYIHELKDLHSAEKQILKALPKMIKAATNDELASGFQEHLEQTREHAERLEKILSGYNQTTRGPKCKGMEGLLAREVK